MAAGGDLGRTKHPRLLAKTALHKPAGKLGYINHLVFYEDARGAIAPAIPPNPFVTTGSALLGAFDGL